MKRLLMVFSMFLLIIFVTGCSRIPSKTEGENSDSVTYPSGLKYVVEQVALSKGYQNTEPKVELIQKNNEVRLLVSPGLLKSAGVEVEGISLDGGKVSITLVNMENPNSELVLPQISIFLTEIKPTDTTDFSYSIVNKNYKPIKVNYGIVDVINKLKADLKISAVTSPEVKLIENNGKLLWDIFFDNIFDRDSKEVPVIDLKAVVDATTGDLVMSKKSLISSLVDEGQILSFNQNHGFLYKNNLPSVKGNFESSLWKYNLDNRLKTFLYGSIHEISYAVFSNDGQYVSFIEDSDSHRSLYILNLSDLKLIKVALPADFQPVKALWTDDTHLSILGTPEAGKTKIISYNMDDNTYIIKNNFDMEIVNFDVDGNNLIVAQKIGEDINRKLILFNDNEFFKSIGLGWGLNITNDGKVAYLEHDVDKDENTLVVYDISTGTDIQRISKNYTSIQTLSDSSLLLTEKNNSASEYIISVLNFETGEETYIGKSASDDIFLDETSQLLFTDLVIPYQSAMSEIIYSLNIENLR